MSGRPALEVAVTSARGARTARECGADRVELCSALELGGITPSAGLVEQATAVGLPVFALVRCRPGGFVYDADEVATMRREARSLARAGVAGVVLGALNPAGDLDTDATRRIADAARDAEPAVQLTFHRAVDRARDPLAILPQLVPLGIERVLTSGGAPTADEGLATIGRMTALGLPVQVTAGGGVRPDTVARAALAGVAAVHLSAKRRAAGGTSPVRLGALADDDSYFVTDGDLVRKARAQLHRIMTTSCTAPRA